MVDASPRLPQNSTQSSISIPISGASKKWTGDSMAEWRERGYVPDSDEEDEDIDGSPGEALVQDGIKGPRHLSQASLPVNREDHPNLGSRGARTNLEGAFRENLSSLEAALSGHHGTFSSIPAPEDTKGPIETTGLWFSKDHESPLSLSVSAWEESHSFHDVDRMELDHQLHSSPVAKELQATLNLGLNQINEVLRGSNSQSERIRSDSQSSSPLSSLGSLEDELRKDAVPERLRAISPRIQSVEPIPVSTRQTSPELFAPQRALRQRTQIQLHPYALEDARYQQELKARGLKPVRIAASQSQQPRNPLQSAGDEASMFSSSPVYEDSTPISAIGATQDEISFDLGPIPNGRLGHRSSPLRLGDDDEDLPDLATIFRDGIAGSRGAQPKTYHARQTTSSRLAERPPHVDVFDFPADAESKHHLSSEAATFFVPPSPPRSGSVSVSDMNDDKHSKKHQDDPTAKRMPTPLVSSEAPSRKRSVVELSDSSADHSDGFADPDSVSSSDEGEKLGRIKAMKRRMKGVLPASWLKLDLKKQTGREVDRRDLHAKIEIVDGKGVAKPVLALRTQTGLARPAFGSRPAAPPVDFSDEEPSSDDGVGLDRAEYGDTDQDVFEHGSMDVPEDNRIDIMQPARERRLKSPSKRRRKQQQRLSDAFQDAREQPDHQITFNQNHGTGKSRLHKASTTKRRRKHNPAPRLTVLDAPGFVKVPRADQPQFLKVASRRTQQQRKKTTQSPRRKFLKLATDRDTGDANQTLRQWEDGHIQLHHSGQANAAKISPATNTTSLPPETTSALKTNVLKALPLTNSSATNTLGGLKDSTDATIQRILFKQQGLPSRPSRTAASTASTTHITASLARLRVGINLRKPIPNRAGFGSLQQTATHTRPAQLEHTVPDRPSTTFSGPAISVNSTNYQRINQISIVQPRSSFIEAGGHVVTDNEVPTQQPASTTTAHTDKIRVRKSNAPQRTQLVISRESRLGKAPAGLSVAQQFFRTSEELKILTDIMAELSRTDGGAGVKDGWSVLWPPLQKWLEVYADKPSIRTPSEKQQAIEIFQMCRELVSKCGWPTAWDDLIRKAAWFFSAFDMVDPFDDQTDAHYGYPLFLKELNSKLSLLLPEAVDSAYYIFLDMLAMSLTRKSIEATDTTEGLAIARKKKNELYSFVNRLYPNDGRSLSEHEEVRKVHLASLWNRCSLYLTLYCYTIEVCRPRLSHFQNLISFKDSHKLACEAILAAWAVLACFHLKTPEKSQQDQLAEMGAWMQSMVSTIILKWVEARQEVADELQVDFHDGHSKEPHLQTNPSAVRILHTNQSNMEDLLRKALDIWLLALQNCECQSTAVQLINTPQLSSTLDKLTTFFNKNDTMFQVILNFIEHYLHKYRTADLTSRPPAYRVLLTIFDFLHKTLARRFDKESTPKEGHLERVINSKLTYDWSLVASALVTFKQYSWDEFLEPAATSSWERFENVRRSAQYQTLFIKFIISAKEEVYRDNKFWYLSYWLRALLRPSHDFLFEHELSKAILKADQYEPILMNLRLLLHNGPAGYNISLADLKQNRTAVLRNIIESIAIASAVYDSQTVDPYALQPSELADLLRAMMKAMGIHRSSLEHGSKERDEYEIMVCKLAEKMERHTSKIVPLERWLTDADAAAFSLYNLRKRLGGPVPVTGAILVSKQEIFWFQHTCQKAAVEENGHEIESALRGVYVDASDISEIEWYQPKLLAMMEQVFPAYLELALTDRGALMGAPLLQVLDEICEDVFMRALNIGSQDHSQLLNALYGIIVSARIAMQRSNVDRDIATLMNFEMLTDEDRSFLESEPARTRVFAFAAVVRIARNAVCQFQEVARHAELGDVELERIYPHVRYISIFVKALWFGTQDGEEDHWSELVEAECHHLEDLEADKIKQFAAESLEKHLRSDWTVDPAGTWWVMQGRAAVSVKLAKTEAGMEGLFDPRLRSYVKEQMEDWMEMVQDTPGRRGRTALNLYPLPGANMLE